MKQYKLSHIARAAMLLAVLAMLAACEKPILDDGSVDGGSPSDANVVLHFTQSEDGDFSSATRAATHAATRAATRAATGISGWRLPAFSDMTAFAASAALTAGRGYLYYDADSALRQYTTGSPWPAAATAATANTYIRPVAEVSISKE